MAWLNGTDWRGTPGIAGTLTELVHGKGPLPPPQALPVMDGADMVVGECHGVPGGETTTGITTATPLPASPAPGTSRGYNLSLPARGQHSSCGTPGFMRQEKEEQVDEPSPRSGELPHPPAWHPHPHREPPPAPLQFSCRYSGGASSPWCYCAPQALGGCSAAEPPTPAPGLSTSLQPCRVSPDGHWALLCLPQPLAGQCPELNEAWISSRCVGKAF